MLLPSIEGMEDLQHLVRSGETDWEQYGDVETKEKDGLILFNYTIGATMAHRWNWFERNSRGLILNKTTGEVVALPFEKVFNYGEFYESIPQPVFTDVSRVTEKMDGSLGILYRPRVRVGGRQYAIATRGAFESDQAKWATERLYYKHNMLSAILPEECTLLFEIIYPENRIVIDYGDKKILVLLAARNRFTGEYYSPAFLTQIATSYGFEQPNVYNFPSDARKIAEMVKGWDDNREGVVVEFLDGSRWKFKAEAYCKVHKLLSRLAFKRILQAVKDGTIDDILPLLPSHIRVAVTDVLDDITEIFQKTRRHVVEIFSQRPLMEMTRKEFALWAVVNHKEIAHYLFRLYDDQSLDKDIFSHEFHHYKGRLALPESLDLD